MKASERRKKIQSEQAHQLMFDEAGEVSELVVPKSDREDEFGPLAGTDEWKALPLPVRTRLSQKRVKRARARKHADLETGRRSKQRTRW